MLHDFNDQHVRDMIDAEHRPVEEYASNGYIYYLKSIKCKRCRQDWPCDPRSSLDNWLRIVREPDFVEVESRL